MEYRIKRVTNSRGDIIPLLEISYQCAYPPLRGGDIICLKQAPIPRLTDQKGIFENLRVFYVASIQGDEVTIKV